MGVRGLSDRVAAMFQDIGLTARYQIVSAALEWTALTPRARHPGIGRLLDRSRLKDRGSSYFGQQDLHDP
jgi:hypothetical protein